MKLKIHTKFVLSFIIAITIMASILITFHITSNQWIAQAREKAERYHNAENLCAKFFMEIDFAETALQDYLENGNQQRLTEFMQSRKFSRQYLKQLQNILVKEPQSLTLVNQSLPPLLNYLDQTVSKAQNSTNGQLQSQWQYFKQHTRDSYQLKRTFFNKFEMMLRQASTSFITISRRVYEGTLVGILLLAFITIAVLCRLIVNMSKFLTSLTEAILKTSTGKYHTIDNIFPTGESNKLIAAFNMMITTIQKNEEELESKNEELQAQSEELSAQNEEILAQEDELQRAVVNLTQHHELLNGLYKFSQSLTQTIDLDPLMKIALTGMMDESQAQVGAFLLYNSESQTLEVQVTVGLSQPEKLPAFGLNTSLAGQAAGKKRLVTVAYPEGQLHSQSLRGELAMSNEIYLSIVFHDKLLGVIALGRTGAEKLPADEQDRLASMADQIAVALNNSLAHLKLRDNLVRIQEVDQLKSELINTVSHELRTPLASIFGFAELLLKKPAGEAKNHKYLTTIYNESLRLTGLINNFLDLQRIENGRLEFVSKTVDLAKLVKSSIELYQGQSSIHELSLHIEANLPPIQTDPDRVTQVLGNLLSNAIKYSPNGGRIEIGVARPSDKSVTVRVTDHGLGIPADALPKLFNPFFRVDNSDRRQIGGTGLGLAICQQIIRALGGEIEVQSEHGHGSTFSFLLPIGPNIAAAEALSDKENTLSQEAFILIVEDDPAMVELINEALTVAGYRTESVNNGPAALNFIKQHQPSIIILDLILPGLFDGWEILRQLKTDQSTCEIPVIISSALDQKQHGFELGAADYLIKPFSTDKLVDSVNTLTKLASGVVGLLQPEHSNLESQMVDLLKDNGFSVKEMIKKNNLLVAVLNNQQIHDKE